MKKNIVVLLLLVCCTTTKAQIGKVGINTTAPMAMLHVKDSSVLFTGAATLPITAGNPPVSGAGTRMMWYPDKAAFRAGGVEGSGGTLWDKDSIGQYSFAVGNNTKAKGFAATAIGTFNTAIGYASTAMGYATKAIGDVSTSMGSGTNATGDYSISMGRNTDATGDYSTAMGNSTNATGDYSTSMGGYTNALGLYSTAMGYLTDAVGDYSTSMGRLTYSKAYASLSVGQFNDSIATSSKTSWVITDPVFIVGNGTAYNARSNAFTVLKNGNTNIAGAITRNATGTANIVPIAYGSVSDAGIINSGTGNYTIAKSTTGIYDITITNENYTSSGYTCSVTPIAFGVNVAVASSGSSSTKLRIRLYNIAGGGLIDYPFSFVVYNQ